MKIQYPGSYAENIKIKNHQWLIVAYLPMDVPPYTIYSSYKMT